MKNWSKTLTTNKIFSYFPSRVLEGCSSAHLAWVYLGYLPHPSTDMTGMPALHIVSCNRCGGENAFEEKVIILKMCIVACCSGQTSETVVGRVEIPETMSNKQQKPGRHFYFEIWFHKSTTTLLELWEKNDFIPFGISQITSQSFYSANSQFLEQWAIQGFVPWRHPSPKSKR